ncbi:hypothetical protein B296_00039751 [Ensete ventricosum]|uniref:PsbP C-terminal domain-containing protein n=1 Tax=Ensete ventricosum TaxID=4639 RepID=A0A426ZSB6_ENSVE|nr:hypothetical protein B296_00039751 [Ensete ventricosum]
MKGADIQRHHHGNEIRQSGSSSHRRYRFPHPSSVPTHRESTVAATCSSSKSLREGNGLFAAGSCSPSGAVLELFLFYFIPQGTLPFPPRLSDGAAGTFLSQGPALFPCCYSRRRPAFQVKAEASPISQQGFTSCIDRNLFVFAEGSGRRQSLVLGAITFFGSLSHSNSASCKGKIRFFFLAFLAGKFYTLTTGANERRWGKMKDKLHEVVDSFKIFDV